MIPNDPLYTQQWHLTAMGNLQKIWDEYTGAGIHVGVYDTGMESTHPDLAGNYDASLSVIIDGIPITGEPNLADPNPALPAHGTTIGGQIAAKANNGEGGVGIAFDASLTSIDLVDSTSPVWFGPTGTDHTASLSAIHQMTNFDVTNNSWGAIGELFLFPHNLLTTGPNALHAAANQEYHHVSLNGRGGLGTIIVQAAGNDAQDGQGSGLNATRFTITVAAIQNDGFAADFSNDGACVLVTAPGTNIVSADLTGSDGYSDDDYVDAADNASSALFPPPDGLKGTSFSTPMVTGVVALMLDANPDLGWRDVQNILAASATHTGSAIGAGPGTNEESTWFINDAGDWNGGGRHFSNDYGYGLVNAYNAVRMAEVWSLFETEAQKSNNEIFWGPWENNTDHAMSDEATVSSSVVVESENPADNMVLEHVAVTILLFHDDFTQLDIFVVSPDGTEVRIADGSGGTDETADSGLGWTFGIDALRGENVFGEWTVRVEDNVAGGGDGVLSLVRFEFYGQFVSADDVYHYTDEFLDMAALSGEGGRTTLADTNGGTDWIDAAAVTGNMTLNLTAGMTTKVNGASWFTIAAGTAIENAVASDGNDTITGNGAANMLYGMRGNDTLSGGLGDDLLDGGANNDTANYQTGGGVIVNLSLAGAQNTGSAALDTLVSIENLIGSATGADTFTGNGFANILSGLGGNDTLRGGAGNDVLTGGLGRDTLFGDADSDIFNFDSKSETKKGAQRDKINHFERGPDDIDLKDIDAKSGSGNQAFKFIGKQDFHDKKGELRYEDKGATVIVQGDINGDGKADFEIFVNVGSLGKGDFLL
ncbi:MAG: S8 family serine peptidase [Methyloceanibacter sp.]|uniref:S8 family serine peptidase n=1 Tax=Methyloceanibacter sp. TaxID=1965321 RepID=UPI003D6D2A2A